LLETISLSTPNLVKISEKIKSTTTFSVAKETDLASTHFVTKSVQTRIFFLLNDVGFYWPYKINSPFFKRLNHNLGA